MRQLDLRIGWELVALYTNRAARHPILWAAPTEEDSMTASEDLSDTKSSSNNGIEPVGGSNGSDGSGSCHQAPAWQWEESPDALKVGMVGEVLVAPPPCS